MKPIQAHITNTKTLVNNRTGADQTLHDAYTTGGDFIQIWTDTPAPVAKAGKEAYVVAQDESYQKNGKTIERIEWRIIPTAFAEKVLGIEADTEAVSTEA